MKVTVVIPARNEETNLATCIDSVRTAAARASEGLSAASDIIVIDDASSDSTVPCAEASGARVLRHDQRRGVLAAWATGVRASETPFVVFVDADSTVDELAFVELLQVIEQPDVGVVSGRAVPVHGRFDGKSVPRSVLVDHSARFSATLLDEVKSRLGDNDFIAIGRLMAIRKEAWNVPNTELPHCDREVAYAARRVGWRAVWVPEAKVYYRTPASFSELRGDWRRTRAALAHAPHRFDKIPWIVQLSAIRVALVAAPIDALCWLSCRLRLLVEDLGRRDGTADCQPVAWE